MTKNSKKLKNVIFVIKNILMKILEYEIIVILLVHTGSAHQECNLKLKVKPEEVKIPVIFHNLRGYDSHFIMLEIGEIVKNNAYINKKGEKCQMNINVIPNNMEEYMAFMLGNHLTFLDSFQFMSSSLEKLVSNLPKEALKYTPEVFEGKELDLMVRKGVYPYDYMDSFDKFNEKLPSKEEFYSILNNEHISDEDYKHAQDVWNTFSCKNMGDYHNFYLASDVLLLADVFENFRKTCLEYYKLDPCHYFTSPGLSWDAMLKMTEIKLELMTDIDMFQFIEKGLRGGISYIANRYGKGNNKYMKEYDEKAPSKYIMYLDANNLYGWAMSQPLPTGGFKWMTQEQIDNLNLAKYKENSNKGFIAEVDLEYPKELHDLHNDYPVAPEKVKVENDMLSKYCNKIADKYNISIGLVHKLIPTLKKKEKYVLHYRNLQLFIDLGLKVTNVHRVLEFDQSPWLKQYIDFNTEKRKNAKNAFEKDFFKLMNNSVFGKTMENIRKRVDVRLVTDEKKLLKLASKSTFVSSKIFNENLVAVHKIKETLTLNRPAYVGMCILDLSKTLMYDFHYNYIKPKYGEKAKLLFTDTDSLTYEIEAEDVYKDFWNDKDKFDSLLEDSVFVQSLRERFPNWLQEINFCDDTRVKWDWMKYKIRQDSILYSKSKAKERRKKLQTIENKLKICENVLAESPTQENVAKLEALKAEYEREYDYIVRGSIIRSRATWFEQGERNTKYFLNLENNNKRKTCVRKLVQQNGKECTNPNIILDEIHSYYSNLYDEKSEIDINVSTCPFLGNCSSIPTLNDDQRDLCEGQLKYSECYNALSAFENNKTPGNEGLTIEFYKFFWPEMGTLLVDSLNYAYCHGELSNTQKQAVITLIEKKDKDRRLIKNWRPISLLNVDVKIGSKAVAKRLEKVLPYIIHYDQSAFVNGRTIFDATRTISDVMDFTKARDYKGIMTAIDFEKAFDSVNWNFLSKSLESFGFGESFRAWIEMFYNNISSSVTNNGFSTPSFNLKRGVRQGDPLSPSLFIIVLELLAFSVRNDKQIRGIVTRHVVTCSLIIA